MSSLASRTMGPILTALLLLLCAACSREAAPQGRTLPAADDAPSPETHLQPLVLSDAEWRARLTPEQYHVLRDGGTERAFSGALWDHHGPGTYLCAGCALPLFDAGTQFDSGTGWPSFFRPIDENHVRTLEDDAFFTTLVEVRCRRCDGHLGHVFDDGPAPTGLRYCMNSAALVLQDGDSR